MNKWTRGWLTYGVEGEVGGVRVGAQPMLHQSLGLPQRLCRYHEGEAIAME
jgi:hypothetical protein